MVGVNFKKDLSNRNLESANYAVIEAFGVDFDQGWLAVLCDQGLKCRHGNDLPIVPVAAVPASVEACERPCVASGVERRLPGFIAYGDRCDGRVRKPPLQFAREADLRLNRQDTCSTREHLLRVYSPVRADVERQVPELQVPCVEAELADFAQLSASQADKPRALKGQPSAGRSADLADSDPHEYMGRCHSRS